MDLGRDHLLRSRGSGPVERGLLFFPELYMLGCERGRHVGWVRYTAIEAGIDAAPWACPT